MPRVVDASIRQVNAHRRSPSRQGRRPAGALGSPSTPATRADDQQRNETRWVGPLLEGGSSNRTRVGPRRSRASLPARPRRHPRAARGPAVHGRSGLRRRRRSPARLLRPDDALGRFAGWPALSGPDGPRAAAVHRRGGLMVPSYVAVGNHDLLVQGNPAATGAVDAIVPGCIKPRRQRSRRRSSAGCGGCCAAHPVPLALRVGARTDPTRSGSPSASRSTGDLRRLRRRPRLRQHRPRRRARGLRRGGQLLRLTPRSRASASRARHGRVGRRHRPTAPTATSTTRRLRWLERKLGPRPGGRARSRLLPPRRRSASPRPSRRGGRPCVGPGSTARLNPGSTSIRARSTADPPRADADRVVLATPARRRLGRRALARQRGHATARRRAPASGLRTAAEAD